MLAHIYAGGGFSADEKRQLLPLVTNLAPPEDDDTWQARAEQPLLAPARRGCVAACVHPCLRHE